MTQRGEIPAPKNAVPSDVGNRLARTEDRPQSAGSDSYTPAPLDYAARRSPWSWRSQLTTWFQLVKIWVTTTSRFHSENYDFAVPRRRRRTPETPD